MSSYGSLNSSYRRSTLVSLSVIILIALTTATVMAQAIPQPPIGTKSAVAMLASAAAEQEQTHEVTHATALGLRPPLPFREPQVGPLIKRSFADDVDRRTTAFFPQAATLAQLTPVTVPSDENRWIRVDLSEQMVIAYEHDRPVRGFIISSGLPRTPTVTGEFRIRTKVREQVMSGENYYLPGVQWVQYFYADYSFHGTYWHNNFGNPMSHGCLNMTNADAKWLFDWAGPKWDGRTIWYKSTEANPGTLVIVTE